MEDLTGKELNQYRILGPLGEGGMAAVYKAYQPSMDRLIAIKILPRLYAAEPGFLARFEQEARVIASLEHPHIIPVHDFGEAEGYTYLVMRFIEGGTLAEMLGKAPLPLEEIQRIIRQVAGALDYAHGRGVIHRDVKPTNVLVDAQANCLLTDFGIAKMVEGTSNLTVSGAFLGTPKYASPEQARGEKLTGRSDVYSLGVILYEMATGRPPFEAETPMALIFKHANDPLPLPQTINPDVSDELERVILKALAKAKEDRYASAGELAAALDKTPLVAPAPAPTPAPPAPATIKRPALKPSRPLPWRWIALGGGGLLALIAGGIGLALFLPSLITPDPLEPTSTVALVIEGPTETPDSGITPSIRQPDAANLITASNVELLVEDLLLTLGSIEAIELNPAGDLLAVGGGMGTWIFEVETMDPIRLLNPGSSVVDLTWSPDGSSLATASIDGVGDVWDVGSGELVNSLFGHDASLGAIAWSPNGTFIATSAFDSTIRVWDANSAENVRVINDISAGVISLVWSPNNDALGAGSVDGSVRIWDTIQGTMIILLGQHDGAVEALAIDPQGTRVASGGADGRVKIWGIVSGMLEMDLDAYGFEVADVAWSPDGERLAESSGLGMLGHVGIFDLESQVKLDALDEVFLDYTVAMDWSASGNRIAGATRRGDLVIWDGETGQALHEIRLHGNEATGLSWSPDGNQLASTTTEGIVQLWDAKEGIEIIWGFVDAPAQAVAWSPDGSTIAVPATDGIAYLLDAEEVSIIDELRSREEFAYSAAWSTDGSRIALAAETGSLTIWDSSSGGRIAVLEGHGDFVEDVAWEPDSMLLASVGNDRTLRVWDTDANLELYRVQFDAAQTRVAWSPDGSMIATGGLDNLVRLLHAEDGSEALVLDPGLPVGALAWSPDSSLLAVGTDAGDLIFFDAATSTELVRLPAHNGRLTGLAFSPDGSRLGTTGIDGGVIIWGIP
jgi:WD40 repeat protein/predicted Ser/Thr protein kinase